MMKSIIYHQELDVRGMKWERYQYLAIGGNEKDLQEVLRQSSSLSKVYKEMLTRRKPILLIESREKERREEILKQYSSFLTVMNDRERCTDRKILFLDLKRV